VFALLFENPIRITLPVISAALFRTFINLCPRGTCTSHINDRSLQNKWNVCCEQTVSSTIRFRSSILFCFFFSPNRRRRRRVCVCFRSLCYLLLMCVRIRLINTNLSVRNGGGGGGVPQTQTTIIRNIYTSTPCIRAVRSAISIRGPETNLSNAL